LVALVDRDPIAVGVGHCECFAEGSIEWLVQPDLLRVERAVGMERLWSFRAREGYPLTLLGGVCKSHRCVVTVKFQAVLA
jgi:hypothetical protein